MGQVVTVGILLLAVLGLACTQTEPSLTPTPPSAVTLVPQSAYTSVPQPTPAPTTTPTPPPKATPAPTPAPTATPTPPPTATPAPTPAPTATPPPPPTATPTPTPAPTATPSPPPTATPAPTPAPTATPTPQPTATPAPTPPPDAFTLIRSNLPWANDALNADEQQALDSISRLARLDTSLATTAASYPWVMDGIAGQDEWQPLERLASLAETNGAIAGTVAGFPWIVDGLNIEESKSLDFIESLAARDAGLATAIVAMPWVADDITKAEWKALQNLNALAFDDASLAKRASAFIWVLDGIGGPKEWDTMESSTLSNLSIAMRKDVSLGTTILGYPWLFDDLTIGEASAIGLLRNLAQPDLSLAKQIAPMPFLTGSFEEHDELALRSIDRLDTIPGALALLTGQRWYQDGLDDKEAVFVSVLAELAKRSPEQFRAIVADRHIRAQQFTLPLAGDVRVYAFRRNPFHEYDPVLPQLEGAARGMEGLMGVPFPRREIIVLYVDPFGFQEVGIFPAALFVGTHLLVTRPEVIQGDYRQTLAHEVAHYYWAYDNAPLWFAEGGANFLASYALDRSQQVPLADRRHELDARHIPRCSRAGIETIQQLIDVLAAEGHSKHSKSPQFYCNYYVGEFLLLNLYQLMGADGSTGAWRELYMLAESEGRPLNETEIYQAFLRNTPAARVGEFKELYNRWHGGDVGR